MRNVIAGAIAAAATCAGVVTAPAQAAPQPGRTSPYLVSQHRTRAGMRATGINAAVARAHGYQLVTLAGGLRVSIKRTTLARLGAHPTAEAIKSRASSLVPATARPGPQPRNTVYGDCGDSDYYLSIYSDGTWSSVTGYDVRDAVDSKDWHTYLQDPSGSQIEGLQYDSGPTGPSWEGTDSSPPDLTTAGQYLGGVDTGAVTLIDGTICVSGDPADVSTR